MIENVVARKKSVTVRCFQASTAMAGMAMTVSFICLLASVCR